MAFDRLGDRDRVQGTPTILVGRSGGSLEQVTLTSPADVQSVLPPSIALFSSYTRAYRAPLTRPPSRQATRKHATCP
jgi:hypothetical protein